MNARKHFFDETGVRTHLKFFDGTSPVNPTHFPDVEKKEIGGFEGRRDQSRESRFDFTRSSPVDSPE